MTAPTATPAAGAGAGSNALGVQNAFTQMPRNPDGSINYARWSEDQINDQRQQFAAMKKVSEAMTDITFQKSALEAMQSAQKGRADKFAEQIKDMYR